MSKPGATHLIHIPDHQLSVECACGHYGSVPVSTLIERFGGQATVGEVIARMRCARCKTRNVARYRITWPGGSEFAMRGAGQGAHIALAGALGKRLTYQRDDQGPERRDEGA